MNYFAFTGLANGLISTACGAIVFLHNRTSWKNRTYALYCLSLSIWSYCYCAWQMSANAQTALFFSRGLMIGAVFIPVFHYHHILQLFDLRSSKLHRILMAGYVLSIGFFILNFTPWFVAGVEQRMFFPFWPIAGPLYAPFLVLFAFLVLLSLWLIWDYRKKASPLIRNQIAWIAIATTIGYGGGFTNFLLWYNIPIPPYLNILVPIFVAVDALLFFKLRLFDIHLFFRDTIVYVMSLIGLMSLLIGGVFMFAPSAPRLVGVIISVVGVLAAPAFYPFIKKKLKPFIERSLFPGRFDYLGRIAVNLEPIRESYTFGDLAAKVVKGISEVFRAETTAFLIRDRMEDVFKIQCSVGFPPGSEYYMRLHPDDALVTFLTQYKKVFVKEEQEWRIGSAFTEISKQLEDFNGYVCCPMFSKRKLEGIIILGPKLNGGMYHGEDHEILTVFTREAEEMLRHLTSMVTIAGDLRRLIHDIRNITQKRIGTSLAELTELATNYESELGKELSRKQKEELSRLQESMSDLEGYLNYLMDWGRLMDERIHGYSKQAVDIRALVSKTVSEFKEVATRQKINLLENTSINDTLVITANAMDIKRVITNLITNALRYTPEGGTILLDTVVAEEHVRITVRDTGKGIRKEDLRHIFEPGFQGSEFNRGTAGLGLAIVNEVVEMHGGKIWAESEGTGKGTSFVLAIPIKEPGNKDNED